MKAALARWRWAGLAVVWDADDTPEKAAATAAASQAPTVTVTVVYVQAGAHLTIGGISIDPRFIQAVPQQQAAITEGTGEQQ